ncbi:MAG TPA: biotin/lipoyl-binding protein, partial [Methylobacterium sp.]
MRQRRLRSLLPAIGLGISLVGPALAQAPGGPPPKVTTAKPVVREIVETDTYTGRFQAVDYVEVRARVTGYLQKVNFQDGATVKKGDLLFVIDRRPYK